MVSTTPNKIIEFPESASSASLLDSVSVRGREYLDATFTYAQENPWRTAVIGVGVVAAAAATAYGASLIAHRIASEEADESTEEMVAAIDPQSLPQAVPFN